MIKSNKLIHHNTVFILFLNFYMGTPNWQSIQLVEGGQIAEEEEKSNQNRFEKFDMI